MLTKTLRELAEVAIALEPAVEYVNLTSSDQGEWMTIAFEALTTVTGKTRDCEELENLNSGLYDDLESAAMGIDWGDASFAAVEKVAGWEQIDRRTGNYRFHPRQFLRADAEERRQVVQRYSVTLSWGSRNHEAARAQLEALTVAMQHSDALPVYEDLAWSDIEEVH